MTTTLSSTAITINVRQTTGTYAAKAHGHKPTATCTCGARQAAEALVSKLGLAPGLLQEQSNVELAYGCSRFTHPGELDTFNSEEQSHG